MGLTSKAFGIVTDNRIHSTEHCGSRRPRGKHAALFPQVDFGASGRQTFPSIEMITHGQSMNMAARLFAMADLA